MILIKYRSAIWTHFRNIHDQNFQFKRDDLKAENRREFTEDEECLECKIGYDNQVSEELFI